MADLQELPLEAEDLRLVLRGEVVQVRRVDQVQPGHELRRLCQVRLALRQETPAARVRCQLPLPFLRK